MRTRNKKLKQKTLPDVKSIDCIDGDKVPIQRLDRNKRKAKLSSQTPLKEVELTKTSSVDTKVRANTDYHRAYQDNKWGLDSNNSNKVRFKLLKFTDISQKQCQT